MRRFFGAFLVAALLISPAARAQAPPVTAFQAGWLPVGATEALSAGTGSSNVQLGWSAGGLTAPPSAWVCNTGAVVAYVTFGGSSVAATTAGFPVNPGVCNLLALNGASYMAGITGASTTSLTVSGGSGSPVSGIPGAGGGGGLVPIANNTVLGNSSGGVAFPSALTTLPSGVQSNITATGTLTAGATGAGFTVALGTSTVTGALGVANGGTNCSAASIACFNNITGFTAAGTTGTTSTNLVFSTSPSLTTPALGVATATSINKVTITAPATSATLTIADGKTLTDTSGVGASLLLGATGGGFTGYGGTSSAGSVLTALSGAGSGSFLAYTNADTASTLVERDSSGNFLAGTITASLTGAASLNLPLTGGTLTGALTIGGVATGLIVNSTTTASGIIQLGNAASSQNATISFTDIGDNSLTIATNFVGGSHGRIIFTPGTVAVLTLDQDLNATFAGQIIAANMTQSASAQTGTVCWAAGGLTYDASLGCLSSSMRFKHSAAPLTGALAEVLAMKPISYLRNDRPDLGRQVGLMAEQINEIDPRLVGLDDEGRPLGVRYMNAVAVLVGAIQEQNREIDALRRRIH